MGVGLANKDEVEVVQQGAPAKGLMGVEVVAQQGGLERRASGPVLLEPAFGGGDFAVLLGVAILGGDELRAQGNGLGLAGRHDDRGERAVVVGFVSAFMLQAAAVRTMDLLGRKVPGAVQRDELGLVDRPEAFQQALLAQRLVNFVIQREELVWRNRIQGLTNVIVTGNLLDLKEALGIAAALGFLQSLLRAQEGGGLSEKDREGAQADVLHRIMGIVAGVRVGQAAQGLAQGTDQLIPTLAAHTTSLRRQSATRGLR